MKQRTQRNNTDLAAIVARLETRVGDLETELVTTKRKLRLTTIELEATERKLAETEARLKATETELAKARKNSSNSSKPPSSDITRPPREPQKGKGKRRRGGQPGHPLHERGAFAPEDVDKTEHYTLSACPACGGHLTQAKCDPAILQQVEMRKKLIDVTEHRGLAYWCAHCRAIHWAPFPEEVERSGLVGPHLTSVIAYLKGACHASFSTIQKFIEEVMGFTVSRGHLAKVIEKVSASLEGAYVDLLNALTSESYLNVDETGHRENKRRMWTWCFRAELYTVFKIDPSRGSKVLVEVLGKKFDGVLGCDYFSAYHKYMGDFGIEVQFCLAHLIRDVKFLTTLTDAATRRYGRKVLDGIRALFKTIHRRDRMSEEAFQRALERARHDILKRVLSYVPDRTETQNLAKRFREHGEAYFRFITTPGMEPTNNLAEQAIRFVVIDRLVTQGTRSEKGRRWSERIWTVLATCRQQGRSSFDFIHSAVTHFFNGVPCPSLLPSGP